MSFSGVVLAVIDQVVELGVLLIERVIGHGSLRFFVIARWSEFVLAGVGIL